jgi:aminoglycoside 3-N-acetyltransferase
MNETSQVVTKSKMMKDLRSLQVMAGDTLMLHVSVKSIGWVVGGPDVVLQSLLDILSPTGTLTMMVGVEDPPYHLPEWQAEKQQAYLEDYPPFDPATSRANRRYSILTEYLRTRPGAHRSNHPEGSFAAVGRLSEWIVRDHPLNYGYGAGSPLARLCEARGKVLLLGAPLNSITLLHYAEYLARVKNKRIAHYKMPVLQNGMCKWVELEEFDTSRGIVDWEGGDYFSVIGREFLASGLGASGKVGNARSFLLDAELLVKFGVQWMEKNFETLP